MTTHDRSRRRKVTAVLVGVAAVIVLAAGAVAVVVLTDVVVDEERRTAPTLPISVPSDTRAAPATDVTVARVVTGDEIVVDDGSRQATVRVAGIDAPDVDTDQCWSKEARSFAERTLQGERVAIGNGGVADGATVTVTLSDGTDYATAAVREGMARAVSNIDLTTTEQQARTAGKGLWGEFCEGQVYPPADTSSRPSTTTTGQPTPTT